MKTEFPYRRIGRRAPLILGSDTLWLGSGHVLSVRNRRFVEEYRRFDLREIQAIVVQKRARFVLPVYWLLACAAAFGAAVAGTAYDKKWLTYSGWAALALLGAYWAVASIFGSCSCHLRTAVGSYELPGLYRRWIARRALQTLDASISEAQGALPEDWIADDTPDPAPPPPEANPADRLPTVLAALACIALLLDALFSWLVRAPNISRTLRAGNMLATVIAVVLPVASIVVSRRDKRFQFMRTMFLIAVLAVGSANYGNTVVNTFLAAVQRAQAEPIDISTGDFFYWLNQIAEVSLGLLGLLHLAGDTRRRQISAP
jgi:hypothetical protein